VLQKDFDWSLRTTLEEICKHYLKANGIDGGGRLMIFIDEVIKSRDAQKMLSLICPMMEETFEGFKTVNVLSTTLDPLTLNRLTTESNRIVVAHSLTALDKIEFMFGKPEFGNYVQNSKFFNAFFLGGVCFSSFTYVL
jgi:hypothetical protein